MPHPWHGRAAEFGNREGVAIHPGTESETMTTSNRPRRHASGVLAFLALWLGAAAAQASVTTVTPDQLAGAATHPYAGPASPILYFSSENPTDDDVAAALGYTGEKFCTRLNSPPGPSGTVVLNGVEFNYVYDPVGQNMYFNWDASAPMLWVTAKGGNSAYVFTYTPQSVDHDLALRSPSNDTNDDPQGLSHFDFCFKEPPPSIEKTAIGGWVRYHDWTLDKQASPDSIRMFDGDSHDVDYTVTATRTPWGSFTVTGDIFIKDPLHRGFTVGSVADSIIFAADAGNTPFHPALACADVDDGTPVIHHCSYSITLSSKVYAFLAGGGGGVNSASAVLTLNGNDTMLSTTANFAFPASPAASFGDTLDADDSMVDGTGSTDHVFNGSGAWQYTHTFACPDDDGGNPNHVAGTFSTSPTTNGGAGADENVDVACETVQVSKTADTSYRASYSWTGDKKIVVRPADLTKEEKSTYCSLLASGPYMGNYACDDITLILNENGIYDTVYQLNATRTAASESEFAVSGVITVSWPSGMTPVFSGDPTDTLHFSSGLPATQDATVSNCVTAATSLTCDYSASLDGKRDGVNWASIVRPHICYDAGGNAGACDPADSSTYQGSQAYAFGAATTQTDECVSVSDLFNDGGLNLGGSFSWLVGDDICASQTWYPTGDIDPTPLVKSLAIHADWAPADFVENACLFEVPNLLSLLSNDSQTGSSDDAMISVNVPSVCNQGCTLTQGYWKTHSKYGPAPYDDTWAKIGEDTLFFNSGKSWMTLFNTPPKGGDAYLQLAHQYMAARLNVEAGASMPPDVATAMASAEALFGAVGSSFNKTQTIQARTLAGMLGSYNEGAFGPGHCSESPVGAISVQGPPHK
jgi:hypothetical protein